MYYRGEGLVDFLLMKFFFHLFFLLITSCVFGQLGSEQRIDSTANGKTLADFIMTDIKGDTVHFYDFKEDIIVFDVWATWCGPCKTQYPIFDSLRHSFYKDTSLSIKFLSISIDKSNFKWKRYVKTEVKERSEKDHFWVGEGKDHIMYFLCTFVIDVKGEKMIGTGVPQYIIIGKNHVIYKRDASQPQSGKLDDEIRKALMN